jgi:hypothetical protein
MESRRDLLLIDGPSQLGEGIAESIGKKSGSMNLDLVPIAPQIRIFMALGAGDLIEQGSEAGFGSELLRE